MLHPLRLCTWLRLAMGRMPDTRGLKRTCDTSEGKWSRFVQITLLHPRVDDFRLPAFSRLSTRACALVLCVTLLSRFWDGGVPAAAALLRTQKLGILLGVGSIQRLQSVLGHECATQGCPYGLAHKQHGQECQYQSIYTQQMTHMRLPLSFVSVTKK